MPASSHTPSQTNLSADQFKQTMAQFATGIVVVTVALDEHGLAAPAGMTINSFNAVSLTPPIVLWSLSKQASRFTRFMANDLMAFNILSGEQQDLANRFAKGNFRQFDDVPHECHSSGIPLLNEASGTLVAHVKHRFDEGDHIIITAEVISCQHRPSSGLVYLHRQYHRIEPSA